MYCGQSCPASGVTGLELRVSDGRQVHLVGRMDPSLSQ